MIKKIVLYLSLFLLSVALFLMATLPVNFVWHEIITPQLKGHKLPVRILALEGTVWDGKALVSYQQLESIVAWDVSLVGLFSLNLPLDIKIESQAGHAKLNVSLGLNETRLDLVFAEIDLVQLNPLFSRQRVKLNGQLVAKNIQITLVDQRVESANGLFSWSGGDIAYPAGRQIHERTLPVFKGQLTTQNSGDIYLGIRDVGASFDLIEGTLDASGSAMLKVKRKLLDLSDEPWPQNSREQDVVFKVKKNIYES